MILIALQFDLEMDSTLKNCLMKTKQYFDEHMLFRKQGTNLSSVCSIIYCKIILFYGHVD